MRKADNLPPSCAVVTKSGNLNFLETSGPVQACNGTALPFTYEASNDLCSTYRRISSSEVTALDKELIGHEIKKVHLLALKRGTKWVLRTSRINSTNLGKLLTPTAEAKL